MVTEGNLMSVYDSKLATRMEDRLRAFEEKIRPLPGIAKDVRRQAFIRQIIDSVHRIRYVSVILTRKLSPHRADPSSSLFDPLKASILHQRAGQFDEACWLVFLSVHFGKNRKTGWRLARDIYGALGAKQGWTWARVSLHPEKFRQWLAEHRAQLEGGDGVARHFGNHRKYQSLSATSPSGTGAAVESYVRWVLSKKDHLAVFRDALNTVGQDSRKAFDALYHSLGAVSSFGRMAKFDYLTMIGKMELAKIEPPATYMQGATGPYVGSKLLFARNGKEEVSRKEIETWLAELDRILQLPFGMQVLEDAICNWQKSPNRFKRFRG